MWKKLLAIKRVSHFALITSLNLQAGTTTVLAGTHTRQYSYTPNCAQPMSDFKPSSVGQQTLPKFENIGRH